MRNRPLKRIILAALALAAAIPATQVYRQYRLDMDHAYRRVAEGGRVIQTACGTVQYSEFGSGAPMLILHGAGGGYDQGEYFARMIGGDYRWIAPSRFGFLGSPAPVDADTEKQAEMYTCLLNALGIERVGVVGTSMGGPSALVFARRYPQRVTSLAMISAASHAIPPRPAALAAVFNVFQADFVFWSLVKTSPSGMLVALGVPAEVQAQLSPAETGAVYAFLDSIQPMGARRLGQQLEQHMSEYDATQIDAIQAATIVLHARDDTLVTYDHAEYTAQHISAAQLIEMEAGGHLALFFDMNAGPRQQLSAFLAHYNP